MINPSTVVIVYYSALGWYTIFLLLVACFSTPCSMEGYLD